MDVPSADLSFGAAGTAATSGSHDVALLIDWENLKISLNNEHRVSPNISSLVEAAREYGRLVLARAYADWTLPLLTVDAPNLYRVGIEPIYVPSRNPINNASLKNSADVRLAVDAVDICGRLPHIKTYVIVTGDRDLIHAVNFLRLNGRRVVVVGVGGATSRLLESAADTALQYERDIEPIGERRPAMVPVPTGPARPPVETIFTWVQHVLRERGNNGPFPFTSLGHVLKQRHNFDARSWYGVPLKELMLRAEAAGYVRLSTIAGFDHASLADAPEPGLVTTAPDAEADAGAVTQDGASEPRPDVLSGEERRARAAASVGAGSPGGLDVLSDEEQGTLIRFLEQLEASSPYVTFNYAVDNLVYHSVLPRLSRDQIAQLVNELGDQGILLRTEAEATGPDGAPYTFRKLILDATHPYVRRLWQSSAAEAPPRAPEVDPFAALPDALAEARDVHGVGYIPAVQGILESRLGHRLRDLNYPWPLEFFQAAAERGLVRLGRIASGATVVVGPDEQLPDGGADGDQATEWSSVADRLGPTYIDQAVRVIAACEDAQPSNYVNPTSTIDQIRRVLPSLGAPTLSTYDISHLLRHELVERAYVWTGTVSYTDPATGRRRTFIPFRLQRDHPEVANILSGPAVTLAPEVKVGALCPLDRE